MKPVLYHKLTWQQKRSIRQAYTKEQKNLCYYCKAPLTEQPPKEMDGFKLNMSLFPPNFLKYPIHLHHDHDTGYTIGSVHSKCNAILFQYHNQ